MANNNNTGGAPGTDVAPESYVQFPLVKINLY